MKMLQTPVSLLIAPLIFGIFNTVEGQDRRNVSSELHVSERGPHQQRIEYPSRRVTENGEELVETNSYVQIQTGLNRWDEAKNEYVPASAAIEMVNGYGVIKNAQFKAVFSKN